MTRISTFALSAILGAILVAGLAGVSQAQVATPQPLPDCPAAAQGRNHAGCAMRGGKRMGRDLNLTEAQKAQIKAIHQKYQAQYKPLRDQAKPFMTAARTARQKGDTASFRSNMERSRQIMQGSQAIRTREQAEIRAILTPDQQAKFDARAKAMSERRASGAKANGMGWGRKGPGRGMRQAPAVKK